MSTTIIQMTVPAKAQALRDVRKAVRASTVDVGCGPEWTEELVLAVDEACQNIIRHAYKDSDTGIIEIEARRRSDERGDALVVDLIDYAAPIDRASVRSRDLDDVRPGGLGTFFIRQCVDECAFLEPPLGAGNHLRLAKRIGVSAGAGCAARQEDGHEQ
ncbi:MAG: ATP-binding protein [Gammaproteobacteria bacterium]